MKEGLFYGLAREVEKEENKINIARFYVSVKNSETYIPWLGVRSDISILEANLGGKPERNVSVISSPEAEAVSGAGCFIPDFEHKRLQFVLPRFHLGVPAQMDMEMAVFQMTHTRIIGEAVDEAKAEDSGIIYFAREGHLTQMQKAVYLKTKENLPTTMVSISHKPAENEYTREAFFASTPNLEGFAENLNTVFLCDPVASGMQHVAMIEKLEELGRLPRKVVVIAPMATRFGLSVIERVCQNKGVEFAAGVAGVLLDTQPPLRYYSPYPADVRQAADTDLHTLMNGMFGDRLRKACIRCNWTGTFWGGPTMPMEASDEELAAVGLSNKELWEICSQLTEQKAIGMKIVDKLLPYSSKVLIRDAENKR